MNKVIYKYPIVLGETNRLELPRGSAIIDFFEVRRDSFFIWVMLCPDLIGTEHVETRFFHIFTTGQKFPEHYQYHKTTRDEDFVWHLLEGKD